MVGVDRWGRVDPDEVMAATAPGSGLVHVQWGNHEVGTTQPVDEIVRRCRAAGVLVHVDAAQAAGRVPLAFDELGADLLSVSGPKFGAPPAPARCSCAGGSACAPCSPAATRSGPGGRAWRTSPP